MNQEEQNSRGLDSHLKTIKLYIYLNNKLILPVDIYPTDTLLDIRQFLSETSQLFFISSYHFEHKGTPLSEFIEISAQKDIENKARIDIKVDPYDEKSARYHLKKAQELIQNPFQYQNIFGSILRALKDPLLIAQELKDKEEKGETKLDDNALEFWEINQRKFGLNEIVQGKVSQFFEISSANRIGSSDINFIELLTFSAFNPPPTHRKLKGDFFYLHLKTLENNEFNITSCPRGFYINLSNQTTYNPTPLDNNVFYNLLDLICSVSPLCRKNLQKLIDEEVNEDNFYMKPLNLYTSETRWLCNQKENDLEIYKYDQIRTENFLIDFHGFDPSTVRDWNEELQMCKDLPKQDLIQRLNKDKVLLKIHSDFVEAATKGAKGIIDQYISPLNPQDDANKQVFVYNQIFFSIVTPTPDSYTQEKGLEASPTPTLANNDLRNLKILHRLDIPELYLLNTAIIDYKGQRILAQTIIPGILSCEHTQHADFGSVDDGKTIQCNAEFNELLKKVCDYFCLDNEVECLEENGNVVPLAGSPEIKGIRSANKKKFILDLARLSPRDANWIGTGDEYICCVIRPELISHFVVSKNFQFASDHIRQELIERKDREIEAQKETHDEKQLVPRSYEKSRSQNDKYLKDLQPKKNFTYLDYINKIQEYLTRNDGKEKYRFNANIYTRTKLKDLESNKHDAQKRDLDELSTFIIRQAMPTLIRDLLNGDIILPYDSKSLGELFHAHGINMRYIGRIYTSIQKEPFPFLHILLQRIMFAKSLKHFFREWLPKIESPYYGEAIAHIFNLVFSPNKVIEKLENKGTPHEDENTQKKLHSPDSEQKEPLNLFVPITLNLPESTFRKNLSKLLRYKPSDVWQRIREICRKRYLFDLPEQVKDFEPFKFPLTKIATLRDVCLSTGIVLECKDYMLMSTKLSKDDNLPFKPEDINDLIPIVKHLDPNCEDAKAQIELANCLTAEGKYEEALENLWGSMQIILNIYGPIHKDIAFCYSKLANIYYRLGEINQAIINHRQSVKILEKFYGFDNGQTGQGYFSLSFLYYHAKQYKKAFSCMFKSLYIFNIIGGEFHPECSLILSNMGLMYQDLDKPQAAINCFFESLERNILMYQSDGLKVANSYQSLALAHLDVHDYVKAIEYQRKCLEILKKNLHSDDARIKDAEVIFEKINKNVEERTLFYNFRFDELRKHQDRNKVKRSKEFEGDEEKDNQDDLDKAEDTIKQKEKEKLIQRLRSAKLNAKYGFRRPGNVDYLRLIQQQTQINGHSFDYPKHTESQSHDLLQGSFLG